MPRIVNDGRLVAMDARLFDSKAKDDPETKTNIAVDKVFDIYGQSVDATETDGEKKWKEKNHLQLIFIDRGVPGRGFNLYQDIKNKLIKKGVKESEIAFIHDAKTDPAKIKLFIPTKHLTWKSYNPEENKYQAIYWSIYWMIDIHNGQLQYTHTIYMNHILYVAIKTGN